MIHVCYALRDESGKYSKFVGTSMLSLFENTKSEITIHLIHDSTLSEENRSRFVEIVERFNQQIVFYNVEELAKDLIDLAEVNLTRIHEHWGTIAVLYRLMILDILPKRIERVIYLDADTIVNLDIVELWNIDLGNFPIAATPHVFSIPNSKSNDIKIDSDIRIDTVEVDPNDYFNAGILMFDLDKLRENFTEHGQFLLQCIEILLQNPRNISLDQDALNVMFKDNFFKLPVRFNHIATWICGDTNFKIANEIYHYCGGSLGIDMKVSINRLWFSYFIKTPFCNPNAFENIAARYDEILEQFRQLDDNRRNLFQKILKASLNRRRIFFVCPNDETTIFRAFGRRDDDIIIDATRENAPAFMFQIAEKFRDHIVIFICIASKNYPEICRELLALGLNENENFFNGLDLITSNRVVYYENSIVRAM